MKKGIKICLIVIGVIIVLGLIFFTIDYNRAKNNEKPIFCFNVATYRDGGTIEYMGLGYKVIDFHTLSGYDEVKIGSWFMQYEDFEEEYSKFDDDMREAQVNIKGYNGIQDIIITGEDALTIKSILEELNYNEETCDGLYSYSITLENGQEYMVKRDCNAIEKGKKQATISDESLKIIEDIVNNKINEKQKNTKIPQEYPMEQAINDGCVVLSDQIYNEAKLDSFVENTKIDSKDRKSDFIRIVQYTIEGDAIITDLEFKADVGYIVTKDNTRDAFGADTKVVTNDDIPAKFYTIELKENEYSVDIVLQLASEIDYDSDVEPYKPITVTNYTLN